MIEFEDRLRTHLEAERTAVPPPRPPGSATPAPDRLGGLGRWMLGAAAAVLVMVTVVGAMRWPDARPPAAGAEGTSEVTIAGRAVPVSGTVTWSDGGVYLGVPTGDGAVRAEGEPQQLVRSESVARMDLDGLDPASAVYLGNLPNGDPVIISDYDSGRSVLGWLGGVFGGGGSGGWCISLGAEEPLVQCQSAPASTLVGDQVMAADGFRSVVAWGMVPDGTVTVELADAGSGSVLYWQTPVSGAAAFEVPSESGLEFELRALDGSGAWLEVMNVGGIDPATGVTTTVGIATTTTWAVDTTSHEIGTTTIAP